MKRTWVFLAIAALIVSYQLFVPPIVGIADQGDFRRVIGKFGYGPEQSGLNMHYVVRKYVPDLSNRVPEWEQFSSQYLFVVAALGVNTIFSKDGKFDIQLIGLVYTLAFLYAFGRLLRATSLLRGGTAAQIAMLLVFTDVAYVAYFNTFYAEPASLIFFLLLAAESVDLLSRGPSRSSLLRWFLWAILFVLAKPANAIPGFLLGLFALRLARSAGRKAWAGSIAILAAAVIAIATAPREMRNANTYNLIFRSVLPESRNPAADLQSLDLDWHLQDYSRTGAWSPNTNYPQLEERGDIGQRVTEVSVLRFYLTRPTRLWRHIQAMLPVAMNLRPPYGNFETTSGYPPV